jgi:hypothetical protein
MTLAEGSVRAGGGISLTAAVLAGWSPDRLAKVELHHNGPRA